MIQRSLLMSYLLVCSATIVAGTARADESRQPFGYRIGTVTGPNDHCCWSANDYCRKLFPVEPCPAPGCYQDCYGRKTPPAIPCVAGCATADDYLRKCFPRPPGQCATPGLPRRIYSRDSRFPGGTSW